ncbi:Kelch repeat-containing protein [Leptospira interrogans]|uniref:Kelch repeat-containing protein n=1 Tax=Leptospira interrogans TaxID=173 RepID=UPI0010BFB7DC|nr:kelch repeat-containing protein [Leptospira interrogans]QCO37972.1 kelch repeat-containing protein [Leptospira interrogans]
MSYKARNQWLYFGILDFILFLFISGCLLHHTDDKISKAPLGLLAILFNNSNPYLNSAELYDPATQSFSFVKNSLNFPRYHHTSSILQDGRVVITGGYYPYFESYLLDQIEIYDPNLDTFQNSTQNLLMPRNLHTATLLQDGTILITGGRCLSDSPATNKTEIFDPQTQTSTWAGNLNIARCRHQSVLLSDGKVLVVGGVDPISGNGILPVEVYDPVSKTFSLKGNLLQPRYNFSVLAPNLGNPILIGGVNYSSATNSYSTLSETERFNEVTGLLSVGPSLRKPLRSFTANLLQDGKILITGGSNEDGTSDSIQILDTTFTEISPKMSVSRQFHTGTVLNNGNVLIAGGRTSNVVHLEAEVFDPNSNSLSSTGSLFQQRYDATSHPLQNGKVLILGGRSSY